jgi:large subunit ribosomal protein L15
MKVSDLTLTSNRGAKRIGRGIGSGYGKTAGRGTKGQNSRTGGGVRPGFEGGQNPWAKRMPKRRGFRALNPHTFQIINTGDLAKWPKSQTVTAASLAKAGLVSQADLPVKLLAHGKLETALTIEVQAASASAQSQVTAAGGTLKLTPLTKQGS